MLVDNDLFKILGSYLYEVGRSLIHLNRAEYQLTYELMN